MTKEKKTELMAYARQLFEAGREDNPQLPAIETKAGQIIFNKLFQACAKLHRETHPDLN